MSVLSKRRRELRSELTLIEKQIFDLETSYLEETKDFGNIFTGWNAHLSTEKIKPKKMILTEERFFSLSSVTSPASRREDFKKSGKAAEQAAKSKLRKLQKKKAEEEMKQEQSKVNDAVEMKDEPNEIAAEYAETNIKEGESA